MGFESDSISNPKQTCAIIFILNENEFFDDTLVCHVHFQARKVILSQNVFIPSEIG